MSRIHLKGIAALIFLATLVGFLAGCGETINGVGKDVCRIGQGVNTVFFRQ